MRRPLFAVERRAPEPADFVAVFRALFFVVLLRALLLLAEVPPEDDFAAFFPDERLAEDLRDAAFFDAVFLAAGFFVVDVLAADFFAAVFFVVDVFAALFRALDFFAVDFFVAERPDEDVRAPLLPLPPALPPPSCLFTVAQARRSASSSGTPRSS
ncbi:hypothetical protein [Coralloluteibacterium thermophilus]|uniref:Uncharacterized protein n=1 Tax=Coralloluteibacterium thermophilum TaxID=2707049 RepID=A0ABV9NMG9_9GAMM